MMIDRNNYEAFLIDYLDGKLSAKDADAVLVFLNANPDIKQEFEGINHHQLPTDEPSFDFSALKKPTYDKVYSQFEPLLIAQLEGEITTQELAQLQAGLHQYPELQKDTVRFAQTKLQPDLSIVFANKSQLKKQVWYIQYVKVATRVAAVLLLISGLWFTFTPLQQQPTQVAQQTIPNAKPNGTVAKPQASISTLSEKPVEKINPNTAAENKQRENVAVLKNTNQENTIDSKQFQLETIVTKQHTEMPIASNQLTIPDLITAQNSPLYQQPLAQVTPQDEYVSIGTFVKRQLEKKQRQVQEDAGIIIAKNQETGKINRVEIASLGIEWSQSK